MIAKEDLLELLGASSQTFKEIIRKELEEETFTLWTDEERGLLHYVILGDFACHIIELYKNKKTHELEVIFELIERFHLEGDAYIKEAATIGILEAIQNLAANSDINPADFEIYLHAESLNWWQSLNDFWNQKIPYVGFKLEG
jgi:hypothetical protein